MSKFFTVVIDSYDSILAFNNTRSYLRNIGMNQYFVFEFITTVLNTGTQNVTINCAIEYIGANLLPSKKLPFIHCQLFTKL